MTIGRQIELGALVGLAFFLPLWEAPKTLFWALYVLAWTVNKVRARNFGGRWDVWDTLIGLWIVSGFVVAAFAGLQHNEWRGALDLLRYGSVAWLLKRTDYSVGERHVVLGALITSVVAGLAVAHWRAWALGAEYLELNSVGNVNHTAIYIAIMLGACAAWLYGRGGVPAAAIVLLLLLSLIMSASRAGIGVGLFMLLVMGTAWWRRSRRPLGMAALLVTVTMVSTWIGGAEVVRKHQRNIEQQNVLAYRDGIWRGALVAWERFPLFGIGMDNYSLIKMDRIKGWREEAGKAFDERDYSQWPHGHSLYFNTLAERGIIGTAALGALLTAWLIALVRRRPAADAAEDDWLWWGAAAGAWMITTGVGLVNTTLHHEHGILAAMFLGLWLSATSTGRSSARS